MLKQNKLLMILE